MIFFSINQLYSFCLVGLFGMICAGFNGILGVFVLKNHQNKVLNFIFKLIIGIIFSIFLIFSINIFYFGQFNPIIISAFFLGYFWLAKTMQNLLDFFERLFYYVCINIYKKVRFYFETKRQSFSD